MDNNQIWPPSLCQSFSFQLCMFNNNRVNLTVENVKDGQSSSDFAKQTTSQALGQKGAMSKKERRRKEPWILQRPRAMCGNNRVCVKMRGEVVKCGVPFITAVLPVVSGCVCV